MFSLFWRAMSCIQLCIAGLVSHFKGDWRFFMCSAFLFSMWAIIAKLDELKVKPAIVLKDNEWIKNE